MTVHIKDRGACTWLNFGRLWRLPHQKGRVRSTSSSTIKYIEVLKEIFYVQKMQKANKRNLCHGKMNGIGREKKKTLERWNRTTVALTTYRSEACTPHQWGSFEQLDRLHISTFVHLHTMWFWPLCNPHQFTEMYWVILGMHFNSLHWRLITADYYYTGHTE